LRERKIIITQPEENALFGFIYLYLWEYQHEASSTLSARPAINKFFDILFTAPCSLDSIFKWQAAQHNEFSFVFSPELFLCGICISSMDAENAIGRA